MRFPVIDLHDYLDMDLMDKLIVLNNNGVKIGVVNSRLMCSTLYALGAFYVETRSRLKGADREIVDAVPFLKGPRLEKYLEQIDMSSLYSSLDLN